MPSALFAARVVLAASAGAVAAVFLLYPAFAWLLSLARRRAAPMARQDLPSVSVITVVRNGEGLVRAKIENGLSLAYPEGKLEVVLYSDGSTDGTERVAREFEVRGVRVLASAEHLGKIHGLNAASEASTGEVLVFTDADALLAPEAVERLVRALDDPGVGGACGQRAIARDTGEMREAQADYIRFDSWIKRVESRLGRITSNDGKLYALRRSARRPLPPAVTDDLFAALSVIEQGRGFVFEPSARAFIRTPSRDAGHEVARRRRIVCRSLRGIWLARGLLNPLRTGWFAAGLFVNKVVRRLLPLALLGVLAASAVLAWESSTWRVVLAAQAAGYLLAAAGPLLRGLPGARLLSRGTYVCAGMLGTLLGLLDFLAGKQVDRWDPVKSDLGPPRRAGLRVAYLVTRFPRVTETFVLQEALQVVAQGIDVQVFPLLRGREAVKQTDVERLLPRVHFLPLFSPGVAWANLAMLARRPVRYVGALAEALRGTIGSLRFFAGAIAFFPKAVLIARQTERLGVRHVHAHFCHHPALVALVVHRLSGVPFSFTAHGSDLHMDQRMLDRKLSACAFAVTVSEYNRGFMAERAGHGEKVRVVRCGVDAERFTPRDGERPAGPLAIACVAALREVKGHQFLIEACRLLRERGVDHVCDVVGDGPERARLEAQAAQVGLGDRVRFLGSRPHEEVVGLLRRADVLVLPSITDSRGRREGIPLALMEAMACGLAVVASRQSGIPELVRDGETGLLSEPGDGASIAAAIERLAADPALRASLGMRGREVVRAEFDQARGAAEMVRLFREHALRIGAPAEDVGDRR